MSKKLFNALLLIVLSVTVISCKKDSPSNTNGDSYVKIKKNGTWVTYQGLGDLGPDLIDNTKIDFGVTGVSQDQKERFDFSIQLDGSNFPTGTYNSNNSAYWIDMSYAIYDASGMEQRYYDITEIDAQQASRYTVNITSITSTELKGTFTGNYLIDDFNTPDPESIPITEGEFKVKRVR